MLPDPYGVLPCLSALALLARRQGHCPQAYLILSAVRRKFWVAHGVESSMVELVDGLHRAFQGCTEVTYQV